MNDILKILYDKFSREEKRKFKFLIINFHKEKIEKICIKHYYALAICKDEAEYNLFRNLYDCKKYFDNITIFNRKTLINIISNMPHFDAIIMNPPYGKTLPFEITKILLSNSLCEKLVYVGPIGKLRSIIESTKTTDYLNEHCDEYQVIENFGEIFKITQREVSGILVLSQNIHTKIYNYGNFKSIYDKIKNHKSYKSVRSVCIHEKREFSIPMQGDNGYAKGWHMTPIEIHTAHKDTIAQIDFNNKIEQENYLNSLNCWPYKIIYLLDDKSAIPAHMPWMSDYSQPWDNKRFCEYFNITGYISETEAEPGSEWETILNEMKTEG